MKRSPPSPKTASPGRPKDANKREGIVRAANQLFMNEGYELTSMEAVAKKADVSKLTIYSHFKNKDELFKAVIRQRCDSQAMPESFLELAKQPVDKALYELGCRIASLIFNSDSTRLHRIMHTEATRHPQIIKIFYDAGPRRVREAFAELIEEFQKQGRISVPDSAIATEQFFGLLKGDLQTKIMLQLIKPPTTKALQEHVRATVDFFLAACRPKSR